MIFRHERRDIIVNSDVQELEREENGDCTNDNDDYRRPRKEEPKPATR